MKSTKNRAISIMICLLMLAQIVPSSWSSVPVFAYSSEPEEMANTKNDIDLPIDPFHVLSYVSAKPATCTDSGNKAYYARSDCGKWFEDSLGTVEITDKSSVVIPASGQLVPQADLPRVSIVQLVEKFLYLSRRFPPLDTISPTNGQ